jgi:hypothetical protein
MLGKLIKLAIVILVVHAAWQVGSSYWTFYRFEDALQEVAQFGGNSSDADLRAKVLKLAAEIDVPVVAEHVTINRTQAKLFIDADYQAPIQILPRYPYPWTFKASVGAWIRP